MLRTERGKLFEIEKDILLLPEKAAKIVAAEETRLRNYFNQTMKQLTAWRQRPAQDGPPPVGPCGMESQDGSGPQGGAVPPGPPTSDRSPAAASGADPGETAAVPQGAQPSPAPAAHQDPMVADTPPVPHATPLDSDRAAEETAAISQGGTGSHIAPLGDDPTPADTVTTDVARASRPGAPDTAPLPDAADADPARGATDLPERLRPGG